VAFLGWRCLMDPVSVASAAAVLLATKGGATLAEQAGKAAWAGLGRLAALVRNRFAGDPQAEAMLEAAQAQPDDEGRVRRLAELLAEHGERDAGFLATLSELVAEARTDPMVGPTVVQVNDFASIGKVVTIGTVQGDVSF
jgi:uncharacterized membrane protein YebE (DUF533 family)